MPTTEASIDGVALCRPIVIALALALTPAPAALAQSQGWSAAPETAPEAPTRITDDDIVRVIDDGMIYLKRGDLDAAYERFTTANSVTFESDDFGLSAKHLPNLALARYSMAVGDWPEMSRFAASVANLMDRDGYRDHPYRLEAMAFQGLAAYLDNRLNEADLILRAVVAATQDRPDLAVVWDMAQFYLAATAYQLSAPDASALRRAYLAAPGVQNGYVSVAEVAYMYFVEMFASRAEGDDPAELAEEFAQVLDTPAVVEAVDPVQMSEFRGFLGLLQSEAGQTDAARAAFETRHRFLLDNGMINDEFLFNVERLAMTRHNLGETEEALALLVEMMDFAKGEGLQTGVYAVFEQDMGIIQNALGQPELAQAHFRRAYAILRQTRTLTDRQILVLRPLIDVSDPGFADFAYADELRAAMAAPLVLAADGSALLAEFFADGYLLLDERLNEVGNEMGRDTPEFLLNRGLLLALIGRKDAALADVEAMRGADPVTADLIELVARVWGAEYALNAANDAIARLEAQFDSLTSPQQSVYLALAIFQAFRLEDLTRARALAERWLPVDAAQPDRADPWHRMASAIMIEAGMVLFVPERAQALWDGFQRDTDTLPPLPLLRDYGRVMYLANAPDALADPGVVVELSGLLRRMQDRLPPYHTLISIVEFSLANAFQWTGESEQALAWMDRTATTLRGHPFHDPDTLAFALSEQSRLLLALGRTDQAALIARESYEMIDPPTARAAYTGRIVTNFANALYMRTLDDERVAALYARHLDDPAYVARLQPETLAQQLMAYADMRGVSGTWDEVREALDRAEAILVRDDGFDRRGWRAQLDMNRAIAEYRFDQGDYGFARISHANALSAEFQAELTAAGRVNGESVDSLRQRATWTALIGWEYAQTLAD